ncbi:MAG: YbhN family protein [bacterium]
MSADSETQNPIVFWLKVVVVVLLMGGLFTFIPLGRTVSVLLNVSALWLLLAIALRAINFFVSSLKLYVLIPTAREDEYDLSVWRVFGIYLAGKFFGNFLPTSVGGDVIKVRELGVRNLPLSDATSSVFLERLTGLLGVVFIAIAVTLPGVELLEPYNLRAIRYPFLGLALGGLALGTVCWNYLDWFERFLESWKRWPLVSSFQSFVNSLREYHGNNWQIAVVLFISVLYHLIRCLYLWIAIRALGASADFLYLLPAIPIVTFVSLIPISLNNLGLREGAITFAFTALGLTSVESLGVALLTRLIGYALSLGGGFYYLKRSKL